MTATSTVPSSSSDPEDRLQRAYAKLRAAAERHPSPPLAERLAHLEQLERAILAHKDALADAIDADFGGRSKHESLIAEVFLAVENIRYLRRNLASWMRAERRKVSLPFLPARAEVRYQPKGVIGVISPWNYPAQLALAPLAGALGAGNRVMLKPSELTPRTSELLDSMLEKTLPGDLVQTVTGGVELGARFASLPFDHLVFTGSTHVGRLVMRAAAENLTPVTLELGGKSPTIVHESYPVESAAEAIALGKWLNAGQTCIAPDYVLVPEHRRDALVDAIEGVTRRAYPRLRDNPDFTSIINARHKARLEGYLTDARAKGATVRTINASGDSLEGTNKLAPTLLTNVSDDMLVMQDEIFGPILPILTYRSVDEAIRYVNDHPRPLALYYFDHDARRAREVLERTTSGGAAINACALHFCQDDLPFGGIGPSGMGAYHGREGFETFSHKKSVFHQARVNGARLLAPPYGTTLETALKLLLRG
jgi:coniferyl-aldehyde dehydrogenase